jgi:endo-beta-N-acetylglucosaminidase D
MSKEKNKNIEYLALHKGDEKLWKPEQVLDFAKEKVKDDEWNGVLVILTRRDKENNLEYVWMRNMIRTEDVFLSSRLVTCELEDLILGRVNKNDVYYEEEE